jgi:hypothetical protein
VLGAGSGGFVRHGSHLFGVRPRAPRGRTIGAPHSHFGTNIPPTTPKLC